MQNSFAQAGKFFGRAYDQLGQAADEQAKADEMGVREARYGAETDQEALYGSVPPQDGEYSGQLVSEEEIEATKEDLLTTAKEKQRPSNGNLVIRASGGYNTAVKS